MSEVSTGYGEDYKTRLDKILDSLTDDKAGTRVDSFITQRDIQDVENLVRLKRANLESEFGFGLETANALQGALERNGLRFGMLFSTPLHGKLSE